MVTFNSNDSSPSGLLQLFDNQQLKRDDYWNAIQRHFIELREFQPFVRGNQLESIEIHSDSLAIVLKNGLRFLWQPEDKRSAPSVIVANGEYETDILPIITNIVGQISDKTILDIGANIGWYSLHLAQQLSSIGGRIFAFEPIPQTFNTLSRNLSLNPAISGVVHPVNNALDEKSGTVTFYVPESTGSVAASQRQLFPDQAQRAVEVETITLDQFLANNLSTDEKIGFVKMDIEGAELLALRGADTLLSQHQPILMLEMLRKWSALFDYHPNDIIALMQTYNYTCWRIEDQQFTEIDQVTEEETATNFFFIPKDKISLIDTLSSLQ